MIDYVSTIRALGRGRVRAGEPVRRPEDLRDRRRGTVRRQRAASAERVRAVSRFRKSSSGRHVAAEHLPIRARRRMEARSRTAPSSSSPARSRRGAPRARADRRPLEQALSEPETLAVEPLSRRHADRRPKRRVRVRALIAPRAARSSTVIRRSQIARPQSRRALSPRCRGDRRVDVLRLAAGAVQGHHEPPRDGGGDVEAVVERDEMQAEVDARGRPRRGHDVVVCDVENVGIDPHARIPPPRGARRTSSASSPGGRREGPLRRERTRRCRARRVARRGHARRGATP